MRWVLAQVGVVQSVAFHPTNNAVVFTSDRPGQIGLFAADHVSPGVYDNVVEILALKSNLGELTTR